jgi:hypothetical protein
MVNQIERSANTETVREIERADDRPSHRFDSLLDRKARLKGKAIMLSLSIMLVEGFHERRAT